MNRHIEFILDRSGSMDSVKTQAISGYNEFVLNLRKDDPDATLALTQFDSVGIERVTARKALHVDLLDQSTYNPRANTPLWDAVGQVVSQSQDNPDTNYMVVIFTDGLENNSREWDREKLKKLIDEKSKTGRWTFLYLGANQDAWQEAAKFGVPVGSTVSYHGTRHGTTAGMSVASAARSAWSAAMASGGSYDTSSPLGALNKCPSCGDELKTGETHVCRTQ